jgi:hypothetical protein
MLSKGKSSILLAMTEKETKQVCKFFGDTAALLQELASHQSHHGNPLRW